MGRPALRLLPLALLAAWGLHWGGSHALVDSADLLRRVEEFRLFAARSDPYADPDLTYPPAAPPVFAALLAPLPESALPGAWLALNLSALAALAVLTVRVWAADWAASSRGALVLAMAASKPVRAGLALGQFHLIPTALAVGAIAALSRGRRATAGVLIGLALVKPTMVVPLLGLWLVRRAWGSLAVAAAVQAALTLATSAWLGVGPPRLFAEWLANARTQEAAGTIDVPTLAARLLPGAAWVGPTATLAALALGVALMASLRSRPDRDLGALGLFLGAVFAYHRHYDLVLLLPALAWLADRAGASPGRRGRWLGAAAVGFGALLILPSHPAPLRRFEGLHDAAFVAGSYLVLALMLSEMSRLATARGPGRVGPAPGRQLGGRPRDLASLSRGRD